jgi:hypothetical protein
VRELLATLGIYRRAEKLKERTKLLRIKVLSYVSLVLCSKESNRCEGKSDFIYIFGILR